MTIIYTLLGVPYVAVIDPVRGVVLQKAARKRIPSPGQMSLFAGNEPKEGDTKVENGVTYRLNQHSRWERADKAKGGAKAKPKAVVPVVEEKAKSKSKVKSKPSGIANMRQEGDTGSRRDETPAMPNFEVVSDRKSQPPGTIFYDDPGVTPEQRAWMEYGGQNYIPATVATRSEIDKTFPNVAQAAAKAREYGYQGADDHEVLARYMAGGATRQVGSQNVYPVYFEDDKPASQVKPKQATQVKPKVDSAKPVSYFITPRNISNEWSKFTKMEYMVPDYDSITVNEEWKDVKPEEIDYYQDRYDVVEIADNPAAIDADAGTPASKRTKQIKIRKIDYDSLKFRSMKEAKAFVQANLKDLRAGEQRLQRMQDEALMSPKITQAEPEAMPVEAVVDEPDDLDQPEALPEPTIGDMLAEQKAEEEAGGMEKQSVSGRELASIIAEKIPSIYSRTAGNLKAFVWTKKENETRVYLKTYKGKDAGYISIRHSDGYITDNSNWADIEPQVDQLLDAILEEYEASPDLQNSNFANSQPSLEETQTANEEAQRKLAAMSREEVDSAIREWRYKMDDDDKYEQALESERKIAKEIGVPSDAIRGGQVVLKMLPEDMLRNLAAKLLP